MAFGLPYPYAKSDRAPRGAGAGLPCLGREPDLHHHVGTPGAWAACPCAGLDLSAT